MIDRERLRTGGAFGGALVRAVLAQSPPARELEPGDAIGAFRIVRELSRGGMAIVYLAERADGEFEQRVALKWMAVAGDRSAAEELFRRERQTLAGLEHPGIARLIDGGRTSDSMLWFAMELVEGEPIDTWCRHRGATRAQRLQLAIELCDALAFAHARLLVHRDIKPANVLVDAQGRVRLLDFGIARLADQRDLLGNHALTPRYASPEQWRGEAVTVSSDVYQAGLLVATLLDLLPVPSGDGHATALDGASPGAAPVALAGAKLQALPRDLRAILRRASALDPAARYAGVGALADDLARFLDHRPVVARHGGIGYRAARFVRRHPFSITTALFGVALLAGAGWRVAVERDAARAQAVRATAQAERAEAAIDFLSGLLMWATPQQHRGEEKTVAEALAFGVDQLRGSMDNQPALHARLLYVLGKMYSQRREREHARALYEESYALLKGDPDADPALLADVAYGLAAQLADADSRPRSLALVEEAMQLYGDRASQAERRIHAWRLKAIRLNQDGQVERAIAENRAALASALEHLGPDNAVTARAMHDLSSRLSAGGYFDEAISLKRRGYETLARLNGTDHPETSLAALGLASLLVSRGDYAEADALVASDGEVRRRLWGEDHAEYARHLSMLARYHLQVGRTDEALAAITRAIAINEASGDHGRTALALQYEILGCVREGAGDLAAALAAFRRGQAPELFGSRLGWDGGDLWLGEARVLRKLGRSGEATPAIEHAAMLWQGLHATHPSRAQLAIERGFASLCAGDARAARGQAERARRLLPARPEFDAARHELALLDARLATR